MLNVKKVLNKGFSLVEMLVVIAVIGIIAAIAIPAISNVTSSAGTATAKRNAQNIASVYASGNAAGVSWPAAATGLSGAAAIIDRVTQGVSGTSGTFRVDGLNAAAKTAAAAYLSDTGAYIPQ